MSLDYKLEYQVVECVCGGHSLSALCSAKDNGWWQFFVFGSLYGAVKIKNLASGHHFTAFPNHWGGDSSR